MNARQDNVAGFSLDSDEKVRLTHLFLDDNPDRHDQVRKRCATWGVRYLGVYTLDAFVDVLKVEDAFDSVSLDHDLNDFDSHSVAYNGQEATGLDACGYLVRGEFSHKLPSTIHIHSVNPCGANAMRSMLERHGFQVEWQPFTESDDSAQSADD